MIRHCQRQLYSSFFHDYTFNKVHLALFTITPFTNFINHFSHASTECFLTLLEMDKCVSTFFKCASIFNDSLLYWRLMLRTGFRFPCFLSNGFMRKTIFIYWYDRPEFLHVLPDMIRASHRRDCLRAILWHSQTFWFSTKLKLFFGSSTSLLNHQFLKWREGQNASINSRRENSSLHKDKEGWP